MFRLLHAKNVARPQLKFKEKVDNSNTPFIPKIFIKPNAVKALPSCKTELLFKFYSTGFSAPFQLPLSQIVDFTNKQMHRERPEDPDVPAALADLIHQQRIQDNVDDM